MQGPGLVSMFDLVWAFQKVLRSLEDRSKVGRFEDEQFTVGQKIEFLLDRISPGEEILFEDLFRTMSSRGEVVVTFLAMLELIRVRQLAAVQDGPLHPIRIRRTPDGVLGVPTEPMVVEEGTSQPSESSAV